MDDQGVLSVYLEVAAGPNFTVQTVVKTLVERGCTNNQVHWALHLIPLAFGRPLLGNLVKPHSDYIVLSPDGDIVDRGRLDGAALFELARNAADSRPDLVHKIGSLSSEVSALNVALQAGSDPKNFRMTPYVLFNGKATPKGLARIEEIMRKEVGAPPARPDSGVEG